MKEVKVIETDYDAEGLRVEEIGGVEVEAFDCFYLAFYTALSCSNCYFLQMKKSLSPNMDL